MRAAFTKLTLGFPALLAISAFVHAADPADAKKRLLMAGIGDSISAGFLAQTPPPHASNPAETKPAITFHAPWRLPIAIYDTKSTDSWASGLKIESNFVHLKKYFAALDPAIEVSVDNVSVTGSQSDQMEKQAQRLIDHMKSGKYSSLEYVTVMLGANDVCGNKSADPNSNDNSIRDNLMRGFANLPKYARTNACISFCRRCQK